MRPRLRLTRSPRPQPRTHRIRRTLTSPYMQLLVAFAAAVGGAWLIAMWAVGLVIIVCAMLVAADAVLRDDRAEKKAEPETRHEEIMDQWRKAR